MANRGFADRSAGLSAGQTRAERRATAVLTRLIVYLAATSALFGQLNTAAHAQLDPIRIPSEKDIGRLPKVAGGQLEKGADAHKRVIRG